MNPWAILGLPPGADRDAIRRAYARKLKGVNPEDDPEGFMALRTAHDAALNQLKWQQQWPGDDADRAADESGDAPPAAAWQPVPAEPADAAPDEQAAALAAERAADAADLAARQQALIDGIVAGAEQAAQHRALDHLLAAPALIDIMARDRIEPWVAAVLVQQLPASDPLVVHAITTFGWADLPPGQRSPDVDRLLRRREEGEFVAEIARRHTPLHVGYLALRDPPGVGWWRRLKALASAEPAQTRQILGLADGPLPGIADWLNADAMAWWRDYHSQPRLRLWMIFTMIPLASVLLVSVLEGAGWPDGAQAGLSLLAWAAPWGLLWLLRRRLLWQADWDRPEWQFAAWPLSVLALPLLAALWPPLPALTPLFLLPLIGMAGWTLLANDRLQPDGWGDLAPGLIRSLPAWLFLALMVGGAPTSDGLGPVRAMAILGCGFAWWQAGDQLAWAARRLLARRGERLGGELAPWLVLAAGALALLPVLGLALADAGLVGRALSLLALPLLAALAALRMASGWQQLGPAAALIGLLLLLFELLSLIDPSIGGSGGWLAGLAETSWLIDERTGWPRAGLIFVLVFGVSTLLRRLVPAAAPWLLRLMWLAFAVALVASLINRPASPDRRPVPAAPKVQQQGKWQPARPIGDTRAWLDVAALQPPPPPGDYAYELRLAVGPNGRVVLCIPARSTGNAALDAALCRQLRERARFSPGLNDAGTAMATVEFFSGRLRIPAAVPVATAPVRCPANRASGPMVAEPCQPERWIPDGSYPAAALAAGHSGTVGYRLEVGPDGRVTACSVEDGSGHATLDRSTCVMLKARARFVPAQDIDGSPMNWTYRGRIQWQLADR
ncbi:MAG: TonB family protein [Alphaproteobacteria bacterium]|nr:TonB family protein [Alphaproteobacteria bacterium]